MGGPAGIEVMRDLVQVRAVFAGFRFQARDFRQHAGNCLVVSNAPMQRAGRRIVKELVADKLREGIAGSFRHLDERGVIFVTACKPLI